jgi:hypothetical protein
MYYMNSEERFKHIEHKIIEATKNTDVGFDEESWAKMELLLNKKDRRKRFILWLFLLIPLIFAGYIVYKNTSNNNAPITQKESTINNNSLTNVEPVAINISTNKLDSNPKPSIPNTNVANSKSTTIVFPKTTASPATNNNNSINNVGKTTVRKRVKTAASSFISTSPNDDETENINAKTKKKTSTKAAASINIKNGEAEEDVAALTTKPETVINSEIKKEVSKQNLTPKVDSNNISSTKIKLSKKEKTIARFYLLGMWGVDNGSVKLLSFNNSKFVPKYGASIGYDITKKISVQAGVYYSNKKYTAGPADYSAKAGSIVSRLNITKADAECKIIEIPIALRYDFLQKNSWGLYAVAGVSSYIMKEEFYNIFYLRNNYEYVRPYTYTGNQHLFSTATVAIGIEKKLSNRIGLLLEPSIGIPLKTIGEGSVKLFSTSLQLGVKYHPFKK